MTEEPEANGYDYKPPFERAQDYYDRAHENFAGMLASGDTGGVRPDMLVMFQAISGMFEMLASMHEQLERQTKLMQRMEAQNPLNTRGTGIDA